MRSSCDGAVSGGAATTAGEVEAGGRRGRALIPLAILAVAGTAAALHAWSYHPFLADDALISLRYARRLLAGDGLTWTDGERVEGYSNLLWTLLVAAVGAARIDLVDAARGLGVACTVAALGAVVWLHRARGWREGLAAAVGAASIAASAPIAVWAVGGLEQPLVLAALAWSVAVAASWVDAPRVTVRDALGLGVLWSALALTRPDGALLVAASAAGLAAARPAAAGWLRGGALAAGLSAASWGGQLLFRLAYYGEWVPNTAHAKLAMTWPRVLGGLRYVLDGAAAAPGVVAPAIVGVLLAIRSRRARVMVAPAAAWLLYVVVIGGDIFPAYRHLVVLMGLAAFLAAELVASVPPRAAGLVAAACAVGLAVTVAREGRDPEVTRARFERWEWDGQAIGRLLRAAFRAERPLLAVDPAGCLPYFSELPSLDLMGLNDRQIARRRPPGFGTGFIGHELGDGAYVLSRRPDLVIFCLPTGSASPCFLSGREMARDPAFHRDYQLTRVEAADPFRVRSLVWVRRAGAVGISSGRDEVRVPGFLFANRDGAVARLDGASRLVGALDPGIAAAVPVRLAAGRWSAEAATSAGRALLAVRHPGGGTATGEERVAFDVPADAEVTVEVSARGPTAIEAVRLRRSGDVAPAVHEDVARR